MTLEETIEYGERLVDVVSEKQAASTSRSRVAAAVFIAEHANSPHSIRLLRPRVNRPNESGAAEKRDEVAPPCMSRKQHSEG